MEETSVARVLSYKERLRKDPERLGISITVSPKTQVMFEPPMTITENCVTAVIPIGIGNDHTAELRMSLEALQALRDGETIDITKFKK